MANQEQTCRQRILQLLPQLREELEKHITHLRGLADKVDQVHRDCTIANVTASTAGILSVIGALLAPFTGVLSTALIATGLGVGATATGVGTAIAETSIMSALKEEVTQLASTGRNILEKIKQVLMNSERSVGRAQKSYQKMESAAECEHGQACEGLVGELQATRMEISLALVKQSELMTRGLRVLGKIANTMLFGLDVYYLVEGSMDLAAGEETELAKRLRQQAEKLAKLLLELNQLEQKLIEPDPTSPRAV